MEYYKRVRFGNVLGKDKILLFGDDIVTARILGKVLKKQGYVFNRIKDPSNIARRVWEFNPKLVILDYSLSGIDNLELCENLKRDRRTNHIPVVILSREHTKTKDIVKGLRAGAEDYLPKPLNTELLLTKIMVILRRRIYREEPEEILKSRGIVLNLTTHEVSVNNRHIRLTPKEFALLYFLMKRKGQVLSRRTLMKDVWEREYFGDMNTVNIHVCALRRKLGSAGKYIEPVEGIGYRLAL